MTPKPPDTELFVLPDITDLVFWDKLMAAGLHQPEPEPQPKGTADDYQLARPHRPRLRHHPRPARDRRPPLRRKRHVISRPPESAKTLVAYLLLLYALRAQGRRRILDFEMGPHAAATLLRELGATDDETRPIHYTEPEGPPTPKVVDRIVRLGVGYCLIDAAAGAYDAQPAWTTTPAKTPNSSPDSGSGRSWQARRRHDPARPRHQERRQPRQVHDRQRTQDRAGRCPPLARGAEAVAPAAARG